MTDMEFLGYVWLCERLLEGDGNKKASSLQLKFRHANKMLSACIPLSEFKRCPLHSLGP